MSYVSLKIILSYKIAYITHRNTIRWPTQQVCLCIPAGLSGQAWWHSPLHDRQQGCTRQKSWNSGKKNTLRNDDRCMHIPKTLPPQSPSVVVQHARLLACLPLQQQPGVYLLGCGLPGLGHSGQQVKRTEGGGRADAPLKQTNMNSGSVSPDSEDTWSGLFFFFAISWNDFSVGAITAPHLRGATLNRELDLNFNMLQWAQHIFKNKQ